MATEGSRTAAGLAAFALLAAGITTTVLVAGSSTPASAADLVRFASCDELAAWTSDVGVPTDGTTSVDVVMEEGAAAGSSASGGDAATAAPTTAAGTAERAAGDDAAEASFDADGTGGTNTVVEGIDEIDVVDRLPDDRALVSRNGALSVVDLSGPTVLSHVAGLPYDARVSVAGDVVWAAGTAPEGTGVDVRRLRLDGDELVETGSWSAPGYLVDARRQGTTLYVVAVDQPYEAGAIPFEGGPVPCDEVWRPEAGADTPAATMLVGLPADGELAPTGAAEVVGSGSGFLVTGDAAYVTTQTWTDTATTGIHRFDLATLSPTGSGAVPGLLPGPFGLSEHEGHLRVATSAQPDVFAGAIERGPAVDIVGPGAPGAGPLAEVFVLDLDGNLDIVGRTGRFGHDGETIHGVRFVGDTGYVVTFLQTDPFWVLDLRDPAAPVVVGELQIPGFSGYLHPIGDGHVVGFGPDGQGRVSARLFDVGDPQAPAVVDEVVLGDDSPVVWDHHAFVALGDARFAVPVSTWPQVVEERCVTPPPVPEPVPLPEPEPVPLPEPVPTEPTVVEPAPPDPTLVEPDTPTSSAPETTVPAAPEETAGSEPIPVEPDGGNGSSGSGGGDVPFPGPICEPVFAGGETGAMVLEVRGDDLVVVDQALVETDGQLMAERVLPTEAGRWVLLSWDRLVAVGGGEAVLPAT